MPPEAAARSAVMAETMLPAAPVTRKTVFLSKRQAGLAVGGGLFLQPDRPALPVLVADLDRAGIAQGFLDQDFGDFRRLAFRFEIDRFDQSVRPLPLVRFGEARDRAAQRRRRAGVVVAVLPAEPRRRHQECARRRNLLVQNAHGGVERFDAHPQGFVPGGKIHVRLRSCPRSSSAGSQ